jgi:hypothetical protein
VSQTSLPVGTAKEAVRKAFEDPAMSATALMALLIDIFSTDVLAWEVETLEDEISNGIGARIPRINLDKIQAMVLVMATDSITTDPLAFNRAGEAFNNDPVDVAVLDMLTPDQAAWAVEEIIMMAPDSTFSENVRRYIELVFEVHGLPTLPAKLADTIGSEKKGTQHVGVNDPDTYGGVGRRLQRDLEDVQQYVTARTLLVIKQLDDLPLSNRDAKAWDTFVSDLRRHLPKPPAQE